MASIAGLSLLLCLRLPFIAVLLCNVKKKRKRQQDVTKEGPFLLVCNLVSYEMDLDFLASRL